MSSPIVDSGNQFSALQSPIDDDSKAQASPAAGRFGKDDIKEQAYQAREMIKTSAVQLKEQVMKDGVVATAQAQLQPALNMVQPTLQKVKETVAGLAASTATATASSSQSEEGDEADLDTEGASSSAAGQWEEVKRRGGKQIQKAGEAVAAVGAKLDAKLSTSQRAQLDQAAARAKKGAVQVERAAETGWVQLMALSRPVRSFIRRNNLQLPAVILMSLLSLWLSLTVIRLVTTVTHPHVPAIDIHSPAASSAWLKFHAGEYAGKAVDMKQSLTDRAAAFVANHDHDLESMRARAVDYREIGLSKLGLTEPTWGEWAWAKLTGRPITWQERVEHVVSLTKQGVHRPDILTRLGLKHEPTVQQKASGIVDSIKASIPSMPAMPNILRKATPEPASTIDNIKAKLNGGVDSIRAHLPGQAEVKAASTLDNIKAKLNDGVDSIRAHLPGQAEAEAAKARAYAATHASTLDNVKATAEYVKNRIVHGSQEAAHIAQDRANELADKAKYKVGL